MCVRRSRCAPPTCSARIISATTSTSRIERGSPAPRHRPPTGPRKARPDDRLQRAIQYTLNFGVAPCCVPRYSGGYWDALPSRGMTGGEMPDIKIFSPDTMGKPLGPYSQITRVKASEFVFIAGQVGAARDGKVGEDFDAQCALTYANIETALKSVGAGWGNVVEFTTYLVHSQDIPKFMAYRKRAFPGVFPNGSSPPHPRLIVDRLVQETRLLEVQTVSAV